MKVTIIYDTIYTDEVNYVNVQTIIFGDDVRYFVQNTKKDVNYRYRGFDTLDDVYDFARYEEEQTHDLTPAMFKTNYAFHSEIEFSAWINSLCDDMNSLSEIFIS